MKFDTNNNTCLYVSMGYNNKTTEEADTSKLLGLKIATNFGVGRSVMMMMMMMTTTMLATCYPMLGLALALHWEWSYHSWKQYLKIGILCVFQWHYILFFVGGNETDITRMFIIQLKISRWMADITIRVSCSELFKKCNMPRTPIDHLFSVLSFFVDSVEKYETNSEIHSINTRHKHDICVPNANPTSYEKGV